MMRKFVSANRLFVLILIPCLAWSWQKSKEDDELEIITQTREVLPLPPPSSTVDVTRLSIKLAPIYTRGLLSKQLRDALRAALKKNRRGRIAHVRAYVSGSGDTRRVRTVVSEVFTDKKQPLPSLDVIQVGRLPRAGAEVAMELYVEERKPLNENGLVFLAGQPVDTGEAVLTVAPVAQQSIKKLQGVLSDIGLSGEDVTSATCFCSSLQDSAAVQKVMRDSFPKATLLNLQLRRVYTSAFVSCEAVARARQSAGERARFLKPERIDGSLALSQAVQVPSGRLVFTAGQIVFGYQPSDVRLAFDRMGGTLDEAKSNFAQVVSARLYPLFGEVRAALRSVGTEFFSQEQPPALTIVAPEGLPALDASLAVSVIAAEKD